MVYNFDLLDFLRYDHRHTLWLLWFCLLKWFSLLYCLRLRCLLLRLLPFALVCLHRLDLRHQCLYLRLQLLLLGLLMSQLFLQLLLLLHQQLDLLDKLVNLLLSVLILEFIQV